MRPHVLQRIVVFSNLLLLRASSQTPEAQVSPLGEFYNSYTKVYRGKSKELCDYFLGSECLSVEGDVDCDNKVKPLLSVMDRRYKSTSDIPEIPWKETIDLKVTSDQFSMMMSYSFLDKELLTSGKEASVSEKAKERRDNRKLLQLLKAEFTRRNEKSMTRLCYFLHNNIIHDFEALGLSGAMLEEVQAAVEHVLISIKATSEQLQKYFGQQNSEATKNIQFITGITQEGYISAIWSRMPSLRSPSEPGTHIALNGVALDALTKALDSEYTQHHSPAMYKLYCICFLLLDIELKTPGGNPQEIKDKFIKTISDLEVLDELAVLYHDLPGIAKTGMIRFTNDPCDDVFEYINKEEISKAIQKACAKKDASKSDACKEVFDSTWADLSAHFPDLINKNSDFTATDMLGYLNQNLLLSTFKVDENTNTEELLKKRVAKEKKEQDILGQCIDELAEILGCLTEGTHIDKIVLGDVARKNVLLKLGAEQGWDASAFEAKVKNLKGNSTVLQEKASNEQYKAYLMGFAMLLFIVDVLMLVLVWSISKSEAEYDAE